MQAEQQEIADFLRQHPPFNSLPEKALLTLAVEVEVAYFRADSKILQFGEPIDDLYVIRSGAVETFRRSGELYNRLAEGGIFGQMGLLMNHRVRFSVQALDDTLLYCLPGALFHSYCDRYDNFAEYFEAEDNALLRQALARQSENHLASVRLRSLITREPVVISETTAIDVATRIMTDQQVSSLLIRNHDSPADALVITGIITDRDLRMRVLATGLDPATAISEVMSQDVIMLDDNAYVFEAMLAMLRHNVHHLPVRRHDRCVGVLALSDIVRHESQSSILLVRGIFSKQTVEELSRYARQIPAVFVRLVNEDANSHMIGSAVSVIGRSLKQRLLELAEEKLGPPPVPYCFLALGSMARDEQLIVTDQDNAIILDNSFQPEQHDAYFAQLAAFVSDGLAACGYPYCSGDIMATNPECRLTLAAWQERFAQWIDKPEPGALLNSSIFFDLDGVRGEMQLAETLQGFIAQKTRDNRRFLAALAHNTLNRTPPLGFFRDFVVEKDGRHKNTINLKRRGTAPLTDVIRVHALAVGSRARNSFERLEDIINARLLPEGKGRELADALEYISMVRIRHQAEDIAAGNAPDNNINPEQLSTFERRNLKEAFQVLDSAQKFLKFCYQPKPSLR